MKTTLQILCEARAKITEPGTWTQGAMARTKTRRSVNARDPEACCWCMIGAVVAVDNGFVLTWGGTSQESASAFAALAELGRVIAQTRRSGSIASFSDAFGRSHAEVLDVYDTAIRNVVQASASVQP